MIESTTNRAVEMLTAYAELIKATGKYAEMHYVPEIEFVVSELRAACEGAGSIPSEADERKAFEAFWYEKMAGRGFSRIRCAKSGWFARAALAVPSEGAIGVDLKARTKDDILKTIADGWELHGYRQGTKECIAFHRGIEYLRAALAASDEILSRQSSEAAESHRSTRNTQGGGS